MRFILVIIFSFLLFSILGQKQIEKQLLKAERFEDKRQFKKAIKLYNKILSEDNSNVLTFGKRGLCYFQTNQFTESLKDFNYFYKTYPNSPQVNAYIGSIYAIKKDFLKSIPYMKNALKYGYKPNSTFYFYYGSAYYFTGKDTEAIIYLEKSYEMDTIHSEAVNNLGWANLKYNPKKACKYFKIAYRKDSLNDININNLGYAYLLDGNLENAYIYFQKAKTINPENSFIYRNIGLYYKEKGDKNLSCQNLNKAIELKIVEEWGTQYIEDLINYCE